MNTQAVAIAHKLCQMRDHARKHPDYHNMTLAAAQTLRAAAKKCDVDLFDALQIVLRRCVDEKHNEIMHWYAAAYLDIEEGLIK